MTLGPSMVGGEGVTSRLHHCCYFYSLHSMYEIEAIEIKQFDIAKLLALARLFLFFVQMLLCTVACGVANHLSVKSRTATADSTVDDTYLCVCVCVLLCCHVHCQGNPSSS